MMNKIQENVNYLRIVHNLSRRQFANMVHVPYTVIERIEKGITKDPQISTVQKIAECFHLLLDDLVYKDLYSVESSEERYDAK
ncbi:helix-turn-helix transcriptional regulator [Longicatena caecimuris]|uniref:helix-turn-helix transcriptional regulator n=1 Tax=Longicatena caecimuris TaxID=1796635 RepID=UPI003AB439ED